MAKHVVLTGPISGTVTCADGTVVDVTDQAVEVDSPQRAGEVAHLIGVRHNADAQSPHSHVCTGHCPQEV